LGVAAAGGLAPSTATAAAPTTSAAAFASASGRRPVRIPDLHTRALLEPQLSLGDDAFARLDAFLDDDVIAHTLPGRDRPLLTVDLSVTTKTKDPSCPICIASCGITVAFGSVSSSSVTRANCPGHRR